MSMLLRVPLIAAVVGALLALGVVVGVAWIGHDAEAAFTGCLDSDGRIRAVALGDSPAVPCSAEQQRVSWTGQAVIGIDGDDGAPGSTGEVGADGKAGADGEDGDDGTAGEDGEDGADGRDGRKGDQGLAGPQGLFGPAGPAGPQGPDGKDGADGKDGKDGTDGTDGSDGTDGNGILTGQAAPTAATGETGDLFVDLTASLLYGPKTSGGWGTPTSILGSPGPRGETGERGPSGFSAVTLESSQTLLRDDSAGNVVTPICDEGDIALGAGMNADVNGAVPIGLTQTQKYPQTDLATWRVGFVNLSGEDVLATLYTVCAEISL